MLPFPVSTAKANKHGGWYRSFMLKAVERSLLVTAGVAALALGVLVAPVGADRKG